MEWGDGIGMESGWNQGGIRWNKGGMGGGMTME